MRIRTRERSTCDGAMPSRPAPGFFKPCARSRRTRSSSSHCRSRKLETACKGGSSCRPKRCHSMSAKLNWERKDLLIGVLLRTQKVAVELPDTVHDGFVLLV